MQGTLPAKAKGVAVTAVLRHCWTSVERESCI